MDAVESVRTSGGELLPARECVVELVGLEPTTRVLWNVGVSDQLTLSDTRHSSSNRARYDGFFYKGLHEYCNERAPA